MSIFSKLHDNTNLSGAAETHHTSSAPYICRWTITSTYQHLQTAVLSRLNIFGEMMILEQESNIDFNQGIIKYVSGKLLKETPFFSMAEFSFSIIS